MKNSLENLIGDFRPVEGEALMEINGGQVQDPENYITYRPTEQPSLSNGHPGWGGSLGGDMWFDR